MGDIKPKIWSDDVDRIINEGTEEELASLRGVPGVRFEPVTWAEISQAVAANDVASISNIGRQPIDLRVYRHFKAKVLSQYASLADYMQHLLFEYETVPRDDDGKLVAVPPHHHAAAVQQKVQQRNKNGGIGGTTAGGGSGSSSNGGGGGGDGGSATAAAAARSGQQQQEKGEREIVLWRQSDFPYFMEEGMQHHIVWATRPLDDDELRQFVKAHRKGWEFVTWVNPAPLASIPGLWHAHIVSRRPPRNGLPKPAAALLHKGAKLKSQLGRHFRSRSTPT